MLVRFCDGVIEVVRQEPVQLSSPDCAVALALHSF